MNCLDLNNEEVIKWISNESLEKTYQVYADNNFILPDYTTWKQFNTSVSISEIEQKLDKILPLSNFNIDKLDKLMSSLPINTQAAYLQNVIYLSENPTLADVYEEGFHAIFDSLVSKKDKIKLLDASKNILYKELKKQGKTINQYVKEISEKYPETYSTMTNQEKIESVLEEELAKLYVDSLQYKNVFGAEKQLELKLIPYLGNDLAKSISNILTKIFNVLKSIYTMFNKNKDVISLFFKQINEGKYKNAITSINENDSIPKTRLLELYEEEDVDEDTNEDYTIQNLFSSEETQRVIRNIASIYFQLQHEKIKNSNEERLDESIYQYFVNNIDNVNNIFKEDEKTLINERNKEAIEYLKKDTLSYIKDFESIIDFEDSSVESEDEIQHEFKMIDVNADEKNPYETSFSKQIKLRIAKSGKIKTNSFKTILIDEKEVDIVFTEAVDVYKTYSALARALSNTVENEDRFNKLLNFSSLENNSDTKAFVNQLIYDMFKSKFSKNDSFDFIVKESIKNIKERKNGFILFPKENELENLEPVSSNTSVILNSILKGFDLWKRTNYILVYDGNNRTYKIFDANINNVRNLQYNSWINNLLVISDKKNKFTPIPTFENILIKNDSEILVNNIINSFEEKGIIVNKDYVKYSLAKYKQSNNIELENFEILLLDNFKLPDDLLLETKISNNIVNINKAFEDFNIDNIIGKNNKGGIESRLKLIAEGNSYFDESVADATYKTADGKTKYNFQYKTFHLQRINEILNSKGVLNNTIIGEDYINPEFIEDNYILQKLKTEEWQELINNRTIFNFTADGLRQQDVYKNKNDESNGVVAGDMSTRDLMLYLLNSAIALPQNKDVVIPIYFGNYESSKTYEFIALPYINNLIDETGKLTNEGAILIENEIKKEFNRIKRESILEDENSKYTKYNTGKTILVNGVKIPYKESDGVKQIDFSNYKALTFSDAIKGLISNEFITLPKELENRINEEINSGKEEIILEDINTENSLLAKALFSEYDDKNVIDNIKKEIDLLNDATILELTNSGALNLLDKRYNTPNKDLNFTKNIQVNVKKILTNNLFNTLFINQLMHGDQALLYKNDGIDMFKRFKMRNASIVSFETSTVAPNLGIDEIWKDLSFIVHDEIISKSGIDKSDIDQADAQNYVTLKYIMYAQYAMGRLNADLANLYDMVDQAEDTSIYDDKILNMQLFTPILKTVGFDGFNALKKSDFLLTKRLTSKLIPISEIEALKYGEIVNNRWKPVLGATKEIVKQNDGKYYELIPRLEKQLLHNRRKVMEGWRFQDNEWVYTGEEVMLSMPISASKLLNKNTLKGHDLKNVESKNINKISLKYYGLQVETAKPHNKIPDPSQYLEIALNELVEDGKTVFNIDNKEYTTNELINLYQDALYQRDDIRFNELINDIFTTTENDIIFKKDKFKEIFVRSLETSGAEKQVIDLAQKGNFNNPLIRDKFIAQIFSYFTKDGLSQKRKGDSVPHFSSYGMKLIKKSVKYIIDDREYWSWEVIPTDSEEYNKAIQNDLQDLSQYDFYPDVDNKPHTRYTENRLQDKIKELGEGGYFIDELRHLKPRVENNKITGYFTEAVLSKYEKEQVRIYNGQKYMFGVRIPSQDKHSGVNIEWVDMLPAHYGSAIAVAKEIVKLSGSDFDIDKLYISKPDGYYIKNEFKQYDNSFEDYIKYQLKNNIVLKNKLKNQDLLPESFDEDMLIKYLFSDSPNKILIEGFLKDLLLPHNKEEYQLYLLNHNNLSHRGYINNLLLQANQQGLANIQTLDGKITDTPASMTYKDKGVLKEFPITINGNINAEDIYNKLGDKTVSNNVQIKSVYQKAGIEYAKSIGGVFSLRIDNNNTNFGNPFSSVPSEIAKGLIPTKSTKESVLKYIDWIINSKEERTKWIREQLISGNLKNKPIIYYKELEEPSHATALDYLINKYDWSKKIDNQQYLLSDDEGKTFVNSNKKQYNVNSFLAHVNMHKNISVGKANIGIDVNWNLLAIVLNRLDVKINPNNNITIGDVTYNGLEYFIKQFDTIQYLKSKIGKKIQLEDYGEVTIDEIIEDKEEIGFLYNEDGKEIKSKQPIQLVEALSDDIQKLKQTKENLRVFDVISTLISSATDEAKEQLNARYGLDTNALNAILPLIAMGGNLSLGIALVNQPIIKEFLKRKSIKNNAILSKEEKKEIYKRDNDIVRELTMLEIDDILKYSSTYTIQDLAKGVRGISNNETAILRDFLKLSQITEYGNNLISAIKLKKGFGSDIYSFDNLIDNLNKLEVFKDEEDRSESPLNIGESIIKHKDDRAKEIYGKLNIVNKLQNYIPRIINLKLPMFNNFRNIINTQTNSSNLDFKKELNSEIESFIYSQIFIEELKQLPDDSYDKLILKYINKDLIDVNSENNIENIFIKFKKSCDKIPQLKDNVLLKKLKITKKENNVYLTLNQLVKLNEAEMNELQDSFTYLTNFLDNLEEDVISPLEFTKVLQAQFIVKDGMQFKFDGISKIFPTEVFTRLINIIENVNNYDLYNYENIEEFKKRFFESIKHKSYIKSVKQDDEKYKLNSENGQLSAYNIEDLITSNGKLYSYISYKTEDDIYYLKLDSYINDTATYKEFNFKGNTNNTLMGLPLENNEFIKLSTVNKNINENVFNFKKEKKIINNEDIINYNDFLIGKQTLPLTFFTSKTKLSEFYNNQTGRNELIPQNYLWSLNKDNYYDLINQDTGEVIIENVDLKTGYKYDLITDNLQSNTTIEEIKNKLNNQQGDTNFNLPCES